MRAAVLTAPDRPLEIIDNLDVESPRAGEVLVRVLHSGICHSDLTVIDAGHGMPVVLGHEAAGEIADVGAGVEHLRVGDKVVLAPLAPCGECGACARHAGTECAQALAFVHHLRPDGTSPFSLDGNLVHRGLGVGAFAEYTVVPASGAVKVPDDTPLDIACVIGCAVQTGVGAALNTAEVRAGSSVLVLGAGGVGQAVVQGARIAGAAHVIVSEPVEERRAHALAMGATAAVDPSKTDLREVVMDLTGGAGVDYAFEAAGSGRLVQTGIELTGVGGTIVMVGAPPIEDAVTIDAAVIFMTMGKRILSSLLGGCWPARDIPRLIGFWREGRLDLGGLVTRRLDLAEVNEGIRLFRETDGVRTVVDVAPAP
ncbi:MAG: zinc-binding dehydrogenase [Actinomycetota bacterium]|nr:zinc-binding dehydrogenase [Actinomycetota bacterium]